MPMHVVLATGLDIMELGINCTRVIGVIKAE